MLHKKEFTKVAKEDGLFQNLWRKLNQLTSDEIKNKKIIMIVSGNQYESIGDDEGYFEFDVRVKVPVLGGKGMGIISDVTNKFKLLQNLLFKNYKQRTVSTYDGRTI